MTTHRFIEVDGRRIQIDDLPVSYERNCDACGGILGGSAVMVNVQVYADGRSDGCPALDLHPGCAEERLGFIMDRLFSRQALRREQEAGQ